MTRAHEVDGKMPLVDVVAQMRNQLLASGSVDLGQLHRLLGDNRKSVDLTTQRELQVANVAPTTAQLRSSPIGPFYLPSV